MKTSLFVRIDLTIPGAGAVTHAAELEELDARRCTMVRIIELDGTGTIHGAGRPVEGVSAGMANAPEQVVPHPDTYGQFPDISCTPLRAEEFEGLWAEALARFPQL